MPSNIAEGQATGRPGRFLYHTRIALGSLGELETDFELARRLGFLSIDDLSHLNEQVARTGKLLHGLARSLQLKLVTNAAVCFALLTVSSLGYLVLHSLY